VALSRAAEKGRGRLVIVSNRLPVSFFRRKGQLTAVESSGGLASGLRSLLRRRDFLWVGWPGLATDDLSPREREFVAGELAERHCRPVFLSRSEFDGYYRGFSNGMLWPLFHYFARYCSFSDAHWRAYVRANEAFARAVLDAVRPGDTVWVHDYHLMLLPAMLRAGATRLSIGFFLHIPFPSSELIRLLPRRRELLEGVLGADLVGFHVYDYVRHFLSSARLLTGHEHRIGRVWLREREVTVDAFPMGIDFGRFSGAGREPEVAAELARLRARVGSERIVLSVDRLDYTKGLPERLAAFELFLRRYPKYQGKVCLVMLVVPSRVRIVRYRELKQEIDELIGRINGRFGSVGWTPVHYLYRSVSFPELAALYRGADVALVTPLRDGMNLVAKEFVASRESGSGVLVLGEVAGAAGELVGALAVNPYDRGEVAGALAAALAMPESEQRQRLAMMRPRVEHYGVSHWAADFLDRLSEASRRRSHRPGHLTGTRRARLIADWRRARRRLVLLDYDGTLVDFAGRPEEAEPDPGLLRLLKRLGSGERTRVVIISGRPRTTLDRWFGATGADLVAEHGGWVRVRGRGWRTMTMAGTDWKRDVRPVLEDYANRTPGTEVEEKELALAWHYRRAESRLGEARADELCQVLVELAAGKHCEVVEGNRVVEVRNQGVDKGAAARLLIRRYRPDLVLAAGDDRTDEDTFAAVPADGHTIRVGAGPSRARFRVKSNRELRALLNALIGDDNDNSG